MYCLKKIEEYRNVLSKNKTLKEGYVNEESVQYKLEEIFIYVLNESKEIYLSVTFFGSSGSSLYRVLILYHNALDKSGKIFFVTTYLAAKAFKTVSK